MNISETVWWLIIVLLILFAVLVAVTIWRAVYHRNRQDKIRVYVDDHFDGWFDHLYYGEEVPAYKAGAGHERMAIEKIFSTFLNNGHSSDIKQRITAFASENFSAKYQKDLDSPLWANRVNALNKIAEFKVPGFTDMFDDRRISKMTRFEFFLYLIYLSYMDMNEFKAKFFYKYSLTEYELKKVFTRLDDEQILDIRSLYAVMPDSGKYAYIDRVSRMADRYPVKWLESLLRSGNSEIRIRALKALKTLRLVSNPSVYMRFFESDVWEERMIVSRLSPYIGVIAVPGLKKCADDPHPLVQNAAIEALKYFHYEQIGWTVELEPARLKRKEGVIQ